MAGKKEQEQQEQQTDERSLSSTNQADTGVGSYSHEVAPPEPEETAGVVQASRYVSEPEGRILDVGEEVNFDGTEESGGVRVNEDVYRRVYPGRARRASYLLLFRKGTVVPKTAVAQANLGATKNDE